MANKPLNTELLDRAIGFAVRAHAGTERRGKGFPYIIHPLEAVEIVATMTADQELLAAAALHDTVEDTDVTVEQIRAEFGDRIASLVASESDTIEQGVSEEDSWHVRKQGAIDRLARASHDAKIVALGDKLSNMRAIARDYAVQGDKLWSLFHAKDPKEHEWHYRGLADALSELKDTFAYREFQLLVDQVFGNSRIGEKAEDKAEASQSAADEPSESIVKLDPHGEMLMQQFRELRPTLEPLAKEAYDLLRRALREQGIYVTAIEQRVKTVKSLAGKLELKGAKYQSIDDITDLVGLRVITFYTDEVDKVAAIAKRVFDIDWQESVDKRKHQLDRFGYNSLHYICRLKTGGPRFELQMRTALQHVWSTIEHDTGYKGDVRIPREYLRQFNRLAGTLEMVDDEFSRLRIVLTDYRRQIQSLVKSGQLDDVPLSVESFRNYLELRPFDRLNRRIAAANQAEIYPVSLMPYLPVLESFGFETLGDVQHLIDENSDDAHQLALSQLAITDLDILSASAALQYLCMVFVMKNDGGRDGIKTIYDTINGKSEANGPLADMMMKHADTLPFMQAKRRRQKTDLKPSVAAVLQDAMKNANISVDDIRRELGDKAADLVMELKK